MKQNKLLSVWIFIVVTSCNSINDPMSDVNLGKITVKEYFHEYSSRGLLKDLVILNGEYDTLKIISIGSKNNEGVLWPNIDRYKFDTLFSVKINFGSDSVMGYDKMLYRPGKGIVNYTRIAEVEKIYKDVYGNPKFDFKLKKELTIIDDVIDEYKMHLNNINKYKKSNSVVFEESDVDLNKYFYYKIWELKERYLMISYQDGFRDDEYINMFAKYDHILYDDKIWKMSEKIRDRSVLNDYIIMDLNLDPFSDADYPYTDRLNLNVNHIGHNLQEEPRSIRKFRFNVTFEDEWGDEILTTGPFEYDSDYILESPSNERHLVYSPIGGIVYSIDYIHNNLNNVKFEKLRKFVNQKNNDRNFDDLKIKYDVTSLIFEDGEVKR